MAICKCVTTLQRHFASFYCNVHHFTPLRIISRQCASFYTVVHHFTPFLRQRTSFFATLSSDAINVHFISSLNSVEVSQMLPSKIEFFLPLLHSTQVIFMGQTIQHPSFRESWIINLQGIIVTNGPLAKNRNSCFREKPSSGTAVNPFNHGIDALKQWKCIVQVVRR